MIIENRYKEIPKKDWQNISQSMELTMWKYSDCREDRNTWWKDQFESYKIIEDEIAPNILEVGCGPFAVNMLYIMQYLKHKPYKIFLNDPLLNKYIELNKPVAEIIQVFNATTYPIPFEESNIKDLMNIVLCINVLDHVYSMDLCLKAIHKSLCKNGILVLGNDLTNEENFNRTPKDDPNAMLHPIRFDYDDIKSYLEDYDPIFEKITEETVSDYHCGSLLFIGRKKF